MAPSTDSDLWLRLVPGGGAENPTLWWAAARFMQGARRFEELQNLLGTFAGSWQGYPRVRRDVHTQELMIGELGDEFLTTRPEASALASEAIFHFRAALDAAVYQLAWRGRGQRPRGTMFPFCRDASQWSQRRRNDLHGVAQSHVAAIEAIQPFNGIEWTANLADLSNRDKHDHTLEIAAIYKCRVDLTREYSDPGPVGTVALGVHDPELQFVFVPLNRVIDANATDAATDELIVIMRGIVDFLNPLLEAEGVSTIQLASA
ncbi:hypothetical protein [Microbacterium stercoris]|uniref:Uncharacterized protein n=1 Tax=Microbacterium stercoris TaxID=2820289 RepID=A0A939QJX1_9MICO|nr:hypothetical protein [Microbacterium stercoris]MBO3664044.1 hypothetical protein [Microbacterium stercoris]